MRASDLFRRVLERPVSVLIATLALVVIGFFSLFRLPVSLLPTLERPRLVVQVRAADRSREDLLYQVVEPLERRFQSLEGVLQVRSTLDDGECRLVLETEWQTDVDRLRMDAERRLAGVSGLDVDELTMTVEAGDRSPIVEVAVMGGESAHQRGRFAEKILLPELGRLEGAGHIRLIGGATLRPVVRPHAAALLARGLTAADVVARLFELGQTSPVGQVRDGGLVRPLVVREPIASLEELERVRVGETTTVLLGEVATITLEEVEEESLFRLDGRDGVLVQVLRSPGSNAVALARSVRRSVHDLALRHAVPGAQGQRSLDLEVIRDSSLEVVEALGQLGLAGFLGLVLGAVVLRVMLGSWRPTLALGLVVPASLIATFGGFYLWKVSLDVVSLAGLALAAGMLVDNAIVVLESIESAQARGERNPVQSGTEQIALALVASFLTTAVVFLPLIYLRGLARAFFGVQAFAIVTSLLVSLLLSLTLTPVLARLLRPSSSRQLGLEAASSSLGSGGWSGGRELYCRLLVWALRRRQLVGLAAAGLVALGLSLLPGLRRELVPEGESQVLAIDYHLPAGLAQREVRRRVEELEVRLRETLVPWSPVRSVSLYLPRDTAATVGGGDREGRVEVWLPRDTAVRSAAAAVAETLSRIPGIDAEVDWQRSAFVSALERSGRRLEVEVSAATQTRVDRLATRLANTLSTDAGIGLRPVGDSRHKPALVLDWDSLRLAQLGADPALLANQVRSGLGGFFAGRVEIDEVEPEILVETTLPVAPELLPVGPVGRREAVEEGSDPAAPHGRVVPAFALGSVARQLRPPPSQRRDGRPARRLAVAPRDEATRGPRQLETELDNFSRAGLAADERLRLGGQTYELDRSFEQLRLALGLAIVLVFLTVAALYESLSLPLVVMSTVPMAAVGAVIVLRLGGQSLNVMSFLGVILLCGIVVNNAIVLIHRIEQLRAGAVRLLEAVYEAARERYRPILMTTLTTLLGMLPLAVLGGQGVELRRSLALAVVGGLLTSLLTSLFLVPMLYVALRRLPHRGRRGETEDRQRPSTR